MISTRFQQALIAEALELQSRLRATLATRDQKHPNPDPDIYEEKFRQLTDNPLNTLLDVRTFLTTWDEYQTKQAAQRKRSRSLGEVMVSHRDQRSALHNSLYRVIDQINSAISSIETIAWQELACALETRVVKKQRENADLEFIYSYYAHYQCEARDNILRQFKDHDALGGAQSANWQKLSDQLVANEADSEKEIKQLELQVNALPQAEPAITLEVTEFDLAGLDEIQAESVSAKKLKECLTATTVEWAQIKILLQSEFSTQIVSEPVICNGRLISRSELRAFRQLTQCSAPEKPDAYLAAFLAKKWVQNLLKQSPECMRLELNEKISRVRVNAKANEDSLKLRRKMEEVKWLDNELGIDLLTQRIRDWNLAVKNKKPHPTTPPCFEQFMLRLREERIQLDYLQLFNNPAFKAATAKQKLLALMLKDVARRAILNLKLIAAELTQKEHYRLTHAAKFPDFEDKTLKWLEKMRQHPGDYAGLNLTSIKRNLDLDMELFFDSSEVIENLKKDMKKYWNTFKTAHGNAYQQHFNKLWERAVQKWQDETIAKIEEISKACEKPHEVSEIGWGALIRTAQAIIPPDQEAIPPLELPKRRAPRWIGWLKTAAWVATGAIAVAGTTAAIVFSLGLATPIIIGAVAAAVVVGGGAGYGAKRLKDNCQQRQKTQVVGQNKRAADAVPLLKTSEAKIHGHLRTTELVSRPDDDVKNLFPAIKPTEAALRQRPAANPSFDLNQNLRYSMG